MTSLTLTRRLHEVIIVDGPCTITVTKVRLGSRSVRLAIEADPSVAIKRGELVDPEKYPLRPYESDD